MSKIVKNALSTGFIVYAEERSNRPSISASDTENCPFCAGNGHFLSQIKYESGDVLVCANKYPALTENAENPDEYGIHEVVADTRDHNKRMHELPLPQIVEILRVIISRYAELSKNPKIRQISVFKNEGSKAGASISHAHWQILASHRMSDKAVCVEPLTEYDKNNELFSDEIFVTFCPNASCFPYEMWLVPTRRVRNCAELTAYETGGLANALKVALTALSSIFDELSYNICFYDSFDETNWFFVRIMPRNHGMAGFELSGAGFINSVSPRKASEELRKNIDVSRNL